MTVCYLFISLSTLAEAEVKLLIGYGDHDDPPYAIERSEKLYSGIIKDLTTEISDELDINITFVKTPMERKRFERHDYWYDTRLLIPRLTTLF